MPALVLASAFLAAGCGGPAPAVETVPVGTEVEVVRADGGVVRGTLVERTDEVVKVDAGPTSRTVARKEIAEVVVVDAAKPTPLPEIAKFREFTVPAGADLVLSLDTALATDTSGIEDAIEATLSDAVLVNGTEVFPVGSVVRGHVASVEPAGKVKGLARMALRFSSISVEGRDERSTIVAERTLVASSTRREDAMKIGIPAAGGAIIGGLLGGKKGAAIGTAVGGGGGAAVVLTTAGDEIRLPRGTVLTISLDQPLDVRVPIARP
jgi:hypothetical protein